MSHAVRRACRVAVLGLAVATATGCSVAGTTFHPGSAVEVGDSSISTRDVDRLTRATCQGLEPQLEQEDQVVPLRLVKAEVVKSLALDLAVRQFAADRGVSPSSAHARDVSDARKAISGLPDDQLEAYLLLSTTEGLVADVAGQVGAQIAADTAAQLTPEPVKGAVPDPDSTEARQIGSTAFDAWLSDHVEVDPVYDLELSAAGAEAVDTSVAYAVSGPAVIGLSPEPDQDATMLLPASQRCGRHTPTPGGLG